MMPAPATRSSADRSFAIAAHFTWIDWLVLIGYLVFTTVLGARLAGKQATIRDFFLGGRKLPWYAVAGSIVATEISAVTFISVPAIVYATRGDLTYLQLMLGAILARVIIAVWFVPAFYEREIYSPYDYMGHRLGEPVRLVTTGLFLLGASLGQGVRVLLTALILQHIAGTPLVVSIWIIGAVAIVWTLLGGITTVIWTDVIQFFVFLFALAAALLYVIAQVPGGWPEIIDVAGQAGKLRLWNLSTDPNQAFTLWAALVGNTLLCLNAYGTDQMIAQRMFCCKGPRQASLAVIASSVGLGVTIVALLVGLGLYAFYQQYPLDAESAAQVAERVDRIFPIFIVQQMPIGLTGLIIAGVFAAAISSLDSVLAALAQAVLSAFYQPWRQRRAGISSGGAGVSRGGVGASPGGAGVSPATRHAAEDRHYVLVSKLLVVIWGLVLCLMAHVADLARTRYADILSLALSMATYTGGALLAAFFLALLRLNVDYRGILWSAPLSVLTVFAISWHAPWAVYTTAALAVVIVSGWLVHAGLDGGRGHSGVLPSWASTGLVVLAAGGAVLLCRYRLPGSDKPLTVEWPWNVPIGFVVAFVLGYLLARRPPRVGQDPPS